MANVRWLTPNVRDSQAASLTLRAVHAIVPEETGSAARSLVHPTDTSYG
jgi:hypothetical protein